MFSLKRRWIGLAATLLVTLTAWLPWFTRQAELWAQAESASGPLAPANFDRPTTSSPIALSADKHLIWVVNPDDDSVSVIGNLDGTPNVITKLNVGDEPQSLALDTNNVDPSQYRVYVANAADNGVTIIRVTASSAGSVTAVVETSLLVTGAEPWNVVAAPDGRRIFVANSGQDTITVIRTDTTPPSVVGNVDLRGSSCNVGDANRHFQPRGMAVTLNGDRLYVTRFLSFTRTGGVQGTDTGKEGVICRLNIPAAIDALPTVAGPVLLAPRSTGFANPNNSPTSAYPNQLQSIVIRGNHAYLPNIASSPSPPLRFDVDTQAFVNLLDSVASGTPADAGALNLHLGARDPEPGKTRLFFANPWAMAFTTESGSGNAYVVSAGSDLLVKLNVNAGGALTFTQDINTTRYIDLNDPANPAAGGANAGKNPLGIVIRNIAPGNNKAFVMNYLSRNVSVINLDMDAVQQVIALTGPPPFGSQDEQLHVGKEIFFSARGHFNRPTGATVSTENRLSSEGRQNCASCHFAGLTDGTVWTFGTGPRKSVPMNGTWSPHNPDDQRILNYSATFDEVQDFELNIRNVSGPGPVGQPPAFDPNHGLLIAGNGNINSAPGMINAFALPNAGRLQHTVTLPGSDTTWPALDALKEWVRFGIRTPNGMLTTAELTAGGGNATGGLTTSDVTIGRTLFFQAGCHKCHGGTKWSVSSKDFVSPPTPDQRLTEADTNGAGTAPNPNGSTFLPRFLNDIGSFNLNVSGANPLNQLPGQPLIGAVEKDALGNDALGLDYDNNGQGSGYNIPALLGIWSLPPYYHNGACETLVCVLADPVHRTQGLTPGQTDPLATSSTQQRVAAFLQSLDDETEFPFNLRMDRHDIFLTPPTLFKGAQVTVGAHVSLFGVRSDLLALGATAGVSAVTVRFELNPPGPATVDVPLPLSAFTQDFGQAAITTTWDIPVATEVSLGSVRVTVDVNDDFPESSGNDNTAQRSVLIRTPPPDATPPQAIAAFISDDSPFNDNDAVIQTTKVQIKFVAVDGAAPASGVQSYCIVSYIYSTKLRKWVEQSCSFRPVPTPQTGTTDTFLVGAELQSQAGVAYAFVWVKDGAGNISSVPVFDVVNFVPDTPIDLNRNDVMILRLRLDAGQNLKLTTDLENPQTRGFGDVDINVFDDFTSPNAVRIAASANRGPVNETVSLSGPGARQVEIRALVNSRFTVRIEQAAAAEGNMAETPAAPAETAADGVILVAGPPARPTAIGDPQSLFMPLLLR
jgi:cytochrome c peroxidase